jgi:hypothetical protein
MKPEEDLALRLLPQLRDDFAEREKATLQFAELLLDAVEAAMPLTLHAPAELALPQLEALAEQLDIFSWDGAPGWDVVLARGLRERVRLPAGASVLDGLGASLERTQQRGELKRRAQTEAARLLEQGRSGSLVAAHPTLLRLSACGMAFALLHPPPDPEVGPLPQATLAALVADLQERGEGFLHAQDEWLARLLSQNPRCAEEPQFRTFFAGLSQTLRAVRTLCEGPPFDLEALLAAVASWQPSRFPRLRAGAPPSWVGELCPPAPSGLPTERDAALSVFARLWFARDATPAGLHALAALFTARCASAAALCEELAQDRPAD